MSALPIRVRLTLAFAFVMAAVLAGMGFFVYVRVGNALVASVDQALASQAREAASHAHEGHSLVDPDVAGGSTLAELVTPSGTVMRSSPAHLPLLVGLYENLEAVCRIKIFNPPSQSSIDFRHWPRRRSLHAACGLTIRELRIPRRLDAVGAPQASRRQQRPQHEPEKIERQAEHHGVNAIPERHSEAHRDEWNTGDE